jgi:SulP family sulfate permease
LAFFPRPVLGGLLLYLGLSLLAEWVWDGWKRLSRLDYGLVIGIIVIIALWGFLAGVGIGLDDFLTEILFLPPV